MKPTTVSDSWIFYPHPNPQAQSRLFCFPYAGGGASIFRTWPRFFSNQVEVCAVQLPGRETRFRETVITNIPDLLQELEQALHPVLDKPFAFFGHSLGAVISFELARRLRPQYSPTHLFVSACKAPHLPSNKPPIYQLPDDEFIAKLHQRYQGIPKLVMEEKELLALLMPVIRADITMENLYRYTADTPLNCPITAFGGLQDKAVTEAELDAWREHTQADFTLHMWPGDHFFLNNANTPLLPTITRTLNGWV